MAVSRLSAGIEQPAVAGFQQYTRFERIDTSSRDGSDASTPAAVS